MVRHLADLATEEALLQIASRLDEKRNVHCVACFGFGHTMKTCASTKSIRKLMKLPQAGKRLRRQWKRLQEVLNERHRLSVASHISYPQTPDRVAGNFRSLVAVETRDSLTAAEA